MTQIVLPHTYHAQQTGYTCGPSTAKVVLSTFGQSVAESVLARECKTTVDGTADIANVNAAISRRSRRNYGREYLRADPPTQVQKDVFWRNAVATLADNRRGMPINIWAPANNHPPGYPATMIMHYISAVGIDLTRRLIYISDSARFSGIEHYWIGADKLATMITPKGYGFLPPTGVPDDPYLKDVLAQLKPWPQLGNRTFVDALAALAVKWAI